MSSSAGSDLVKYVEAVLGVSLGDSVPDMAIVIVTTSFAVVVGLLVLVWKRSLDRSKEAKPVVPPRSVMLKEEEEEEEEVDVASGKTKVTIFYGTQTGTAEGFAKVYNVVAYVLF